MKYILQIILIISFNPLFSQEYRVNYKNEKAGVITDKNVQVIPNKYFEILFCKNFPDYVIAQKNLQIELINIKTMHKQLLDEPIETFYSEDDSCFINVEKPIKFKDSKKIGLIMFPGTIILPAQYSRIYALENYYDYFLVQKDKKYSFYKFKEKKFGEWFEVSDPWSAFNIDNDMCYLSDDQYFLATSNNKIVLLQPGKEPIEIENISYKTIKDYDLEDILLPTKKGGKYGCVDIYNNEVIPFEYEDIGLFSPYDSNTFAKKNGKYGIIDKENLVYIPFIYDKIELRKNQEYYGTIKDKTVLVFQYNEPAYSEPSENDSGKFGFSNEGNTMPESEYEYDGMKEFVQGLAAVKKGDKWGFITYTGDLIIDYQYDDVLNFSDGRAGVRIGNHWGFIDLYGNLVIKNIYQSVNEFQYYKAKVVFEGETYEINIDGNKIQ